MRIFKLIRDFFGMLKGGFWGCKCSSYDKTVDDLIRALTNDEIETFSCEGHFTHIKTKNFTAKLWTANKYYSFLSHGTIASEKQGLVYRWDEQMPSFYTMYIFENWLRKHILLSLIPPAVRTSMSGLSEEGQAKVVKAYLSKKTA